MTQCCRICLKPSSGNRGRRPNMTNIFEAKLGPKPNSPRLVDLFTQYTTVECTRSDGLPSSICQTCVQQLLATHEFCQTSRRSDRQMRSAASRKHTNTESTVIKLKPDENGRVFEADLIAFDRMCAVESADMDDDDNLSTAVMNGLVNLKKDDDVEIDDDGFIATVNEIEPSAVPTTTLVDNESSPPSNSTQTSTPVRETSKTEKTLTIASPPANSADQRPERPEICEHMFPTCQQTFAGPGLPFAHQRREQHIHPQNHSANIVHCCRICLKPSSGNRGRRPVMTNIFEAKLGPKPNSPRLDDLFTQYTTVECTRSDGLPSSICQTCVQQLLATHEFCQTSRLSDRQLRAAASRKHTNTETTVIKAKPDENGRVFEADLIAFDRMCAVESTDMDDDDNLSTAVMNGLVNLKKDDDIEIDDDGFIATVNEIEPSAVPTTTLVDTESSPPSNSTQTSTPVRETSKTEKTLTIASPPANSADQRPERPENCEHMFPTCQQTFAGPGLPFAHQRREQHIPHQNHSANIVHCCRICLKPSSGNRGRRPVMTNIFEAKLGPKPNSPRLVDLFTQYTTVECTRSDGLPSSICQTCVQQLHATHEFRQTSRRSDRQLRAAASQKQTTTDSTVIKAKKSMNAESDDEIGGVDFQDEDDLIAFDPMSDMDDDADSISVIAVRKGLTNLKKEDDGFIVTEYEIPKSTASPTALVNTESPPSSGQNSPPYRTVDRRPPLPRTNSDEHKCTICQKTFAGPRILFNHQRREQHFPDPTHLCAICGKVCKTRAVLRHHMYCHTEEANKRWGCAHCPIRSAHKSSLLTHLRAVHFNLKPHQCAHCQRCFAKKETLSKHVRYVHLRQRPHACISCPKSFHMASSLRKHELTHMV